MTTRARTRPTIPAAVVAELALPALTVTFGLQLLRLMIPTVMSVYRDRLGAPLLSLALFAFGVFLLGFLAAPVARLLGAGRALALGAGGVALVRLVLQLVPDALARWLLAPVGVVLFLWFVPLWLVRPSRHGRSGGFGLALLLGLALDTALHGLFGTWDYAWSLRPAPVALAALLAAAALWSLARLPPPAAAADAMAPVVLAVAGTPAGGAPVAVDGRVGRTLAAGGSDGTRRVAAAGPAGRRPGDVLPLAGIGPALFLNGLVWQNLGWQAVLGRQPPARAFLLVMLANLAALAAGVAAAGARGGRAGWPVTVTAAVGLAVAVLLGERATVAACFLGQAAAATVLVAVVRRATPDRQGPSLAAVSLAWTLGMLLFLLLTFLYYASYDLRLPFGNQLLLPVAAALLALAGIGAGLAGPGPPTDLARTNGGAGARGPGWLPLWVGVALLLAPAAFWASTPTPVRAGQPGPPLRVMSYNLHFGYDVEGRSDLEATARAVEAGGADVVGLQEVSRGWYLNGSTDMLAWLQRRLRMPYARFAGAADAIWGNAILSRYPIADSGVVRLPREGVPLARNYLWAELDLDGGRLRLVVTHLHHIEGPEGAKVRLAQLPRLLEGLAGRRATVLLGDFNAEPGSREIALLRGAGLVDAFQAAGGGAEDELTYPSDRPERRIDYLWLSSDLRASGFDATTVTASDHRGVVVTVAPAA
ncbi:MAG TPA: endonuclease/exonuclease/phosphatase family protein [Actinomycetota bacterium]|nr:endonuclease/exonuclease/phosphatase family protein [Actinomycetota bacterium]